MRFNRAHAVPLRLIDGPLVDVCTVKQQLVRRMADDLIADGVDLNDKRSAMRCLFNHGYPSFDAARLFDEARALAFQDVVAREMSGS